MFLLKVADKNFVISHDGSFSVGEMKNKPFLELLSIASLDSLKKPQEAKNPPDQRSKIPLSLFSSSSLSSSSPPPESKLWVTKVVSFSSEFSSDGGDYGANCVIGPPTFFPDHGDSTSTWCHSESSSNFEYIEVEFERAILPTKFYIFETFNPSCCTKVSMITHSNESITLWTGLPTINPSGSVQFEINVNRDTIQFSPPSKRFRFEFSMSLLSNDWYEIDAIQAFDALSTSIDVDENLMASPFAPFFGDLSVSDLTFELLQSLDLPIKRTNDSIFKKLQPSSPKLVPAHSILLYTYSETFRNWISDGLLPSDSLIVISDIDPLLFQSLLELVYSRTIRSLPPRLGFSLYLLCKFYGIAPSLQNLCLQHFISFIDDDNRIDIFANLHLFGIPTLNCFFLDQIDTRLILKQEPLLQSLPSSLLVAIIRMKKS